MGFAGCLHNRYNSHTICCGSSPLWGFEMFSTAPKRFEYHMILNIKKKTKRSTKITDNALNDE